MASYSEQRVKEIIAEELDVKPEQVVPAAKLGEDLKADSLDLTELVMKLEEEYDIDIPEEDVEEIKTVGDILAYVAAHVPV